MLSIVDAGTESQKRRLDDFLTVQYEYSSMQKILKKDECDFVLYLTSSWGSLSQYFDHFGTICVSLFLTLP